MQQPVDGAITLVEVIGLVGAPLLAIIVGIVTKLSTPSNVKALLLLGLAAVDGVMTEYLAGPANFDLRWAALKALSAFLIAVGAHYGFLKPTGVSYTLQSKVGRTDSIEGGGTDS